MSGDESDYASFLRELTSDYECEDVPISLTGSKLLWEAETNLVVVWGYDDCEDVEVYTIVGAADTSVSRLRHLTEQEYFTANVLSDNVDNLQTGCWVYAQADPGCILNIVRLNGKKKATYCVKYTHQSSSSDYYPMYWLPESHLVVSFRMVNGQYFSRVVLIGASDRADSELRSLTNEEYANYMRICNQGIIHGFYPSYTNLVDPKLSQSPVVPNPVPQSIDTKYVLIAKLYKGGNLSKGVSLYWLVDQHFVFHLPPGSESKPCVLAASDRFDSLPRKLTPVERALMLETEERGIMTHEDNEYTRE